MMTDRERLEEQIREVLMTETTAIRLSDRLFSPGGLFSQLANEESERRLLVQSPLFQEAQQRLSLLEQKEAAEFARAVEQARAALPESDYRLKIELTQ